MRRLLGAFLLTACGVPAAAADAPGGPFHGDWRTTIGLVKLTQNGDEVHGTYGNTGQFAMKGSVKDKVLTFEYQEGEAKGDGRYTLDDSGNAFTGGFQIRGGRGGKWDGWRPDPKAKEGPPADFHGLWLTDLGLMELKQDGAKVKGRYAVRGTSEIEGDVTGRHLEFRYKGFRPGSGWFDLAEGGKSLAGAAGTDGFPGWYGWRGRPAPEFARHAPLAPGKTVDGSTDNLLTYAARAPEVYREGRADRWPTVLILHGSNMNARSYVNTFAVAFPDLARDHLVIGINGETPSDTGDDPRFNYSYVNYVGRSTYRGFPGTDRESPALVAEAMKELKGVYPVARYVVGGHSQGGFLTYSLLMNDPGLMAGAFPISAGVIFQCEPDAYADEALRKAQRAVPLAVVHGKNDPVVGFASGEYAATLFGEAGWPAFRFFTDDQAGHMFARLPVAAAVRWLEALASDDPAVLLDFAESRAKEGAYRDAVAALARARALGPDAPALRGRAEALTLSLKSKAGEGAKTLLPRVKENKDGSWVDDFLAYRDQFEFADGAGEVMAAFNALRARHTGPAKAAIAAARAAFQQGKQDEGYAKYEEVTRSYYASPSYRTVKRWLAERR